MGPGTEEALQSLLFAFLRSQKPLARPLYPVLAGERQQVSGESEECWVRNQTASSWAQLPTGLAMGPRQTCPSRV